LFDHFVEVVLPLRSHGKFDRFSLSILSKIVKKQRVLGSVSVDLNYSDEMQSFIENADNETKSSFLSASASATSGSDVGFLEGGGTKKSDLSIRFLYKLEKLHTAIAKLSRESSTSSGISELKEAMNRLVKHYVSYRYHQVLCCLKVVYFRCIFVADNSYHVCSFYYFSDGLFLVS